MFTRQHTKHRFQVDVPQPTRRSAVQTLKRGYITGRLSSATRRRKRRFQIESVGVSRWRRLAPQRLLARARIRVRWRPLTLGERRQLTRIGVIAGAILLVFVVIAGGLALDPQARDALFPTHAAAAITGSSSPSDLSHGAFTQPLHDGALVAYGNLHPYVSTNGVQPPDVQATAAFLFDPQQGLILDQKNPDTPYPAASLTKVMTLLVALDSPLLDQPVTIGPDAAALVNSENSYMDLSAGEHVTVRELLYGLIVQGGNDAALAIADAVGGDEPSFVAMMNLRARELGLRNTHFVSADGLDDSNLTSASDMAKLAAVVLTRPDAVAITSTYSYTIPQTPTHKIYQLQSQNDLLPGGAAPYPGANGVKTGYTAGAQYVMAFSAVSNGHLLVGVLLGEPSAQARDADAHTLLDWGFKQEPSSP